MKAKEERERERERGGGGGGRVKSERPPHPPPPQYHDASQIGNVDLRGGGVGGSACGNCGPLYDILQHKLRMAHDRRHNTPKKDDKKKQG